MFFSYGLSQDIPYVDKISYTHTESQRLALPSGTSFDDLHAYDIPSLEYKEISYRLDKSLDEAGNPQTIRTVTNGVNFYEEWQRLSERWLFNQNGTTLYSRVGKGRNKTYNETDLIHHSRVGLEMYQDFKNETLKYGFLTSMVFPNSIIQAIKNGSSSNGILLESNLPYTIAPDGSLVMTNTGGEYMVYQLVDNDKIGIIKYIKYQEEPDVSVYPVFPDENDPNVMSFSISVFDQISCDELLLKSKTEVSKEVLFNGLCAKRIIEEFYDEYDFQCNQSALRSSNLNHKTVAEMTLFPNPLRSDVLTIFLPVSLDEEEVEITISNLNGQKLGQIIKSINGNTIQFNVGDSLSTQGLYIISIRSSGYSNNKKIFYTKN